MYPDKTYRTIYTGQNVPRQNKPENMYRTNLSDKMYRTKYTGQNTPSKIYPVYFNFKYTQTKYTQM